MSHTPGPWTVSPFRAEVLCSKFGRDGDLLPVARMLWPTDERSEVETEANAYLMAAAPELLAACKAALDEDNGMMCSDQIAAAIAKVEGQS